MTILDSIESIDSYESDINLDEINNLILEIEELKTKEEKFNSYLIFFFLCSFIGLDIKDIKNLKNNKYSIHKEIVIFNKYYFTNKNIYYEYLNMFHCYLIIFIKYVQSHNYPI